MAGHNSEGPDMIRRISSFRLGNQLPSFRGSQRLLVPAYFYPTKRRLLFPFMTLWEYMAIAIYNSLNPAVIVMNPGSGPGPGPDPAYTKGIDQVQSRAQDVIGYVNTREDDDSLRDLNTVKREVDRYYSWYPRIRGIFFDQMSNNEETKPYFQDLYQHVKGKAPTSRVVGNPGINADTSWQLDAPVADVLVVFEGPYQATQNDIDMNTPGFTDWSPPAWVTSRSPTSFANLVYECPDLETIKTICKASQQKNAGWIFVTRDVRNPGILWDVPPEPALISSSTLFRREVNAPL
jgi:Spherulation-specific family 4